MLLSLFTSLSNHYLVTNSLPHYLSAQGHKASVGGSTLRSVGFAAMPDESVDNESVDFGMQAAFRSAGGASIASDDDSVMSDFSDESRVAPPVFAGSQSAQAAKSPPHQHHNHHQQQPQQQQPQPPIAKSSSEDGGQSSGGLLNASNPRVSGMLRRASHISVKVEHSDDDDDDDDDWD
jgi:hypothetical protein